MQWSPLHAFRLSSKIWLGDFAHDRIPRGAEAVAIADDQVGRVVHVGAGVHDVAIEDAGDADAA